MRSTYKLASAALATVGLALTACVPDSPGTSTTTTPSSTTSTSTTTSTTTTIPVPCAAPSAPVLSTIASSETLSFSTTDASAVEVAVLASGEEIGDALYVEMSSLSLSGQSGLVRVLARSTGIGCGPSPTFDVTYTVAPAYPGRSGTATGVGVPKADSSITAWASGHSDYSPGTDVTAGFQVPENAYGTADASVVVLGNGGMITMTFDAPIVDGAGADLAVFENGFALGALDFLELAYVEVSSDGTNFARFDSASRRTTSVGGFSGQAANEIGGLAGKDLGNYGTPFDLGALSTSTMVRDGRVDLNAISHVRVVDIVGDGNSFDSFGRPIYDAFPTTGSGGFDLAAVAVL